MPISSSYTPVVANPYQGELITLCRILDTLATQTGASQAPVVSSIATSSGSVVINTSSSSTLAFSTTPASSGSVTISASVDGTTFVNTTYVALTSGNSASTFNAATQTIGQINTTGLNYIKFTASALVGTLTITTVGSTGVSNVMLDNPLPAGTNVIGGVTLPQSSTASVTSFTSTSSAQVLASNTSRKGIVFYNQGAGSVYILLGTGTASSTNFSVGLGTGDNVTITGFTGALQGIFTTAGTLQVTELS
jgi:hypothetical protein